MSAYLDATLYMNMHMCTTSRILHANLGMQGNPPVCALRYSKERELSLLCAGSARWRKAPAVFYMLATVREYGTLASVLYLL